MATFMVRLRDEEFPLCRDSFQELFPECIWTSALEMSSDSMIEVENPAVTPKLVRLLQRMAETKTFGQPDPDITPEEYRAAHRYLNIPILACMAYPAQDYQLYWSGQNEMTIRQKCCLERYESFLYVALVHGTIIVMEYIWAKIPATQTVPWDEHIMVQAATFGRLSLVEGLLRRGLTPYTEHKNCSECKWNVFFTAEKKDQLDIVQMMLLRLHPAMVVRYAPLVKPKTAKILLTHPELE